jgi:hypothetical protein
MTVHARSDVSAVTISPESGGCGAVHSRPVTEGAPVKLWSLTCPSCEDVLRGDSSWSGTISGIPETPDEKAYREDQELKGRVDQQNQTAEALSRLASLGDLPSAIASLASMFSGEPKRENQQPCPSCSKPSFATAKFCGHCGNSMVAKPATDSFAVPDFDFLSEEQLRELAKERGLKPHPRAGKPKLIELLKGE